MRLTIIIPRVKSRGIITQDDSWNGGARGIKDHCSFEQDISELNHVEIVSSGSALWLCGPRQDGKEIVVCCLSQKYFRKFTAFHQVSNEQMCWRDQWKWWIWKPGNVAYWEHWKIQNWTFCRNILINFVKIKSPNLEKKVTKCFCYSLV